MNIGYARRMNDGPSGCSVLAAALYALCSLLFTRPVMSSQYMRYGAIEYHALCMSLLTELQVYSAASSSLMRAIACAGLRPLGHVREQLKMVWQRYKLISFCSFSLRCSLYESCSRNQRVRLQDVSTYKMKEHTRESAIQRYAAMSVAGPRYSSWFHQ